MFFFKVEISSFDDAAKTLFIVPEQHTDEQGVPFEDKMLTQTADFKQFVKSTQTCMVDGKYTQYKTDGVFESITEQQFEQLKVEGKVEELDSNSFSISTGFSPKKGGGKKDFKTLLIIGGAAIVLIALLIFSSMSGGGKSDVSETTESTETVETTSTEETESTDAPETSESSPAESESKPSETTTSSTENSEYVDEPTDTTSEPTDEANEDGYTDSGYSGGSSSSSGGSGIYTISFNLNGGTGTLDSISENAGQYVVLPSAEEAAKTVSKKGYKLIGFSDNTEIAYPLYHYKMPYENVTLFAVWEPDTFYVTYNSNGGTGQLSKAAVKYGADVPLPTDISVYKDGLYLTGWAKTDGAKTALKTLAMPAENLTLYAVWSEKKPTAKITLHFDDKVQIVEKEIGSTVDMLDSFGVFKDGCTVSGCLANGITTSGNTSSAGGICGTAYGTEIFDDGEKSYMSGGTIIGCGVRTFTSKATNSGGIVGTATADTNSAYIKSCYAANIYLNGENNGGIVGADGKYKAHRIVYCLVDNANGYAVVGGDRVRSISKRMVLSVPADSGLTVDGVLSVLNASGSGFDNWERSENKNGGYPYPSKITF